MLAILEADKRVSDVERVPVHVRESSRGHFLSGDEADVPGRQRAGAQVLCLRAAREPGGEGAPATAEEVTVRVSDSLWPGDICLVAAGRG